MFSPLARGTGSWANEFDPQIKTRKYTVTLPEIDTEVYKHPVTPKPRPHTAAAAYSKGESQIQLPKTYITRKGALLLFTAPENELQTERNSFRQKLYNKLVKSSNSNDFIQRLGTLERLSLSILKFGDEGFGREDSSISDPDSKFFLRFLHAEDEGDIDTRSQPGGDLPSYLRDLRYRASSQLFENGDTYMPKSREAQELRAILRGLDSNWPPAYPQDGFGRSGIADHFTRPISCPSARSSSPVSAVSGSVRQVLSTEKLVASLKSSYCQTPTEDDDSQRSQTSHSGRLLHRRHSAQTRLSSSIKEESENEDPKKKGKGKNAYWPVTGMMGDVLGVVGQSKNKNEISVEVMGQCEQLQEVKVDGLKEKDVSIVTSNMEIVECNDSLDFHTEEYQVESPDLEEATDIPDKNEISVVLEHSFVEDDSSLEIANQIQVEVHVREVKEIAEQVNNYSEHEEVKNDSEPGKLHECSSGSKMVRFNDEIMDNVEKITEDALESDNTITDENIDNEILRTVSVENNVLVDSSISSLEEEKMEGGDAQELNVESSTDSLNELSSLVEDPHARQLEEDGENDISQALTTNGAEPEDVQDALKPRSVIQEDEGEDTGSVLQPLMPQYTDDPAQRPESTSVIAPPPSSCTSTTSPPGSGPPSELGAVGTITMKKVPKKQASTEDLLQRDPTTLVSEHLNSPVQDIEISPQDVTGPDTKASLSTEVIELASCVGEPRQDEQKSSKILSKAPSDKISDMLGISSVQPDSVLDKDKPDLGREPTGVSKSSRLSVKSSKHSKDARVRFPESPDAIKRTSSLSKKDMEKGLKKVLEAGSTVSSSVLDLDDKEGMTEEELIAAQEALRERMSSGKEKMDAIEKTPAKKKKGESAKGVRKKKDSTVNKDALNEKEMRKLEKQRKLDEVKALQQKIADKAAARKAQEDEVYQKSRELEEEIERIQQEADEMERAEEDARLQLAESRQKQRDEREVRRREALEKKKLEALDRREKEKKVMEEARKKEQEMLDRIADSEMRRRLKEEEERKKEEEERIAQERLEAEFLAERQAAEDEEERMRELERQAEEEAMQRLIDERNEAEQRRRELDEERQQMHEAEARKREIMLAEEARLQEEQRQRQEIDQKRMDEERRRLQELERLEEEAREQIRQEVEKRRQSALRRREKNLEAKENLEKTRQGQGITRPWVFSYFVHWPKESYEKPFGSNTEKKGKKGSPGKKKAGTTSTSEGDTLDADTSMATTNM